MFLVALLHADDFKTKKTDFNVVWRLIVKDIGYLEHFGINIDDERTIKCNLVEFNSDNLGMNMSLGLNEGFQAILHCRICKLPRTICQTQCTEVLSAYRTNKDYEKELVFIENSTKVNLAGSSGMERFCISYDLTYFNVFTYMSGDIMHDLNEGVILFLLQHFFTPVI